MNRSLEYLLFARRLGLLRLFVVFASRRVVLVIFACTCASARGGIVQGLLLFRRVVLKKMLMGALLRLELVNAFHDIGRRSLNIEDVASLLCSKLAIFSLAMLLLFRSATLSNLICRSIVGCIALIFEGLGTAEIVGLVHAEDVLRLLHHHNALIVFLLDALQTFFRRFRRPLRGTACRVASLPTFLFATMVMAFMMLVMLFMTFLPMMLSGVISILVLVVSLKAP